MQPRRPKPGDDVAELKLRIIAQREVAARMARSRNAAKARTARETLLKLLFQLDLLESRDGERR
jgi:hypothetical protein